MVQESAMAKAISGHSAAKSGMATAAIPVAPPLVWATYIHRVSEKNIHSYYWL